LTQEVQIEAFKEEIAALRKENTELKKLLQEALDKLNKNSKNSSKPPSSDIHRTKSLRISSGKKAGGQQGHKGTTLQMSDTPHKIVEHPAPIQCSGCGQDLKKVDSLSYQRRQVYDIPPIEMQVCEHRRAIKCCPECGTQNRGDFPIDVPHSVQYGNHLKAWAVYLLHHQLLPYGRTAQLIENMTGHCLSTGTLVSISESCRSSLSGFVEEVKDHLQQAPLINSDETGYYFEGKRQWLHVAATEQCTFYFAHENRGRQAMDAMGVLGSYEGIVMHDYWKSYLDYECTHALCNVHHLRDLSFCEEQEGSRWAGQMKSLLLEMKQQVDHCKEQGLATLPLPQRQELEAKYHRLIKRGYQQHPLPQKEAGKRGVVKKSKTQNLLERFALHCQDVVRFIKDFRVPFGNNVAEQAIRMMKVKQKISGCFRSKEGANCFATIRSYIDTMRKQGHSIIEAISQAIAGKPLSLSPALQAYIPSG
jgi:transposase